MPTIGDSDSDQKTAISERTAKHGVVPILVWASVCAVVIIWGNHRLELLLLVVFLSPLIVIHLGSMALMGTCCWGIAVERVSIFYGGPWCHFNVGGIPVEIGYWPTGGYVRFLDGDKKAASGEGLSCYERLHPWQRLTVILSGPSLQLLIGSALLGSMGFLGTVKKFYPTFLAGTISPGSKGVNALAEYFGLLGQGDYRTAFGHLAIVLAMINLLPLRTVSGGEALLELAQILTGRRLARKAGTILQLISLLMLMAVMIAWAFALVLVLFFR